ncbi:hypothetical protein ACTOJ1_000011 [Shigella flexneri]
MKNNDIVENIKDQVINFTNSTRKNEFDKLMKKNNIPYDFKIPFKANKKTYKISLLFQSTLFMFNKYYDRKNPVNTGAVLNIIEHDDFDPYTQSIKNIPDFLFTYLFVFLSTEEHLRQRRTYLAVKSKRNLHLVKEDFKCYFNIYYNNDYNKFYTDIFNLAHELYLIQHPLLNQYKMEIFLADVSLAFIMDRSNASISNTINPKTDANKIEPNILRNIAYLPFKSYQYCSKDVGSMTYPLKTIFTNYEYFNINTILKHSDFIFEKDQLKKYQYCYEAAKVFLHYYNFVSSYDKRITILNNDTATAKRLATNVIECLSDFEILFIDEQQEQTLTSFFYKIEDDMLVFRLKSLLTKFKMHNIMNSNTHNDKIYRKQRI